MSFQVFYFFYFQLLFSYKTKTSSHSICIIDLLRLLSEQSNLKNIELRVQDAKSEETWINWSEITQQTLARGFLNSVNKSLVCFYVAR